MIWSEAYRRFADEDLRGLPRDVAVGGAGGCAGSRHMDGILESEADRLRRWRDDGESSSVSEVDPPDDFDAVIEDRYTTVAEPYHEILDM